MYVYVPENLEKFKKDVTLQNRVTKQSYELPEEGAAVSEKTATLLDLKVGDELTLKKDDKEYKVKISVITENYAGHYAYMSPQVYEETFGEKPDYSDIVFTVKEGYELGNNINSKILAFAFSLSAEIERNLISQRTKEALARKKVQGAKLGRPKGERPEACKLKGKEEMILQYIKEHKTKVYISKKLGVNRQTLREFLKTHPEIPRKWKRIQKD